MLATCFYASFLLGLFFDPEDGEDLSSETRRYILEDRNLQVIQLFQRNSAIKKICVRLHCVEIRFHVFIFL
jgi:hypothetical protein